MVRHHWCLSVTLVGCCRACVAGFCSEEQSIFAALGDLGCLVSPHGHSEDPPPHARKPLPSPSHFQYILVEIKEQMPIGIRAGTSALAFHPHGCTEDHEALIQASIARDVHAFGRQGLLFVSGVERDGVETAPGESINAPGAIHFRQAEENPQRAGHVGHRS